MVTILRTLASCLKFSCVEDEVEMRVSEDEGAIDPEDATLPAPHHRPPNYNPEDYSYALAKFARVSNLYMPEVPKEKKTRSRDKEKNGIREVPQEMSLKQFSSLQELLKKLREDLKMSYLSFVKELVREPNDGVTLLLDVLKMIQLAQTDLNGSANTREQQLALRRALIDEHESLSCLRYCLRSTDASLKLVNYHHGLYTLAVATMSNLARSRTLALQLLTRACVTSSGGHRQVMEALATLRLRFAEPVKCKFLVAMMLSHPHPSFQVWSLRFINALAASATSLREKIYLQEELSEAGFDAQALRKIIERSGSDHLQQQAVSELDRWSASYIDVGGFENEIHGLKNSNTTLQEELKKLREANMKLLEENVLLKTVGSEVEERYAALQRRLVQNGIPFAPSPVPSVSDSDLSSLNTFRNASMNRSSISPSRNGVRTDIMETDSVIFSQGGEGSLTPVWNGSPKSLSHSASSKDSTASDETAISSRSVSASGSSDLTPVNRSRNQSASSTPELRKSSPMRSLTTSPIRNGDGKECLNRHSSFSNRTTPVSEPERKKSPSEDRYNEHMPLTHIDMTIRTEKPSSADEMNLSDRSRSPPDGMVSPQEPIQSSKQNSRRQRQQISESPIPINGHEKEGRKSISPTQKDNRFNGKSSSASHTPSPKAKSPSLTKRKAPKPPHGSASPFSSSTSSLSSSSSTSSNSGGERKDPQYMNVPFHESFPTKKQNWSSNDRSRSGNEEGDLDYERDVVVYEAITVANDRIFIDKNNTQGSHGSSKSQSSVETKGSLESKGSEDSNSDGPNVRQSVRHYENLVMMSDSPESKTDGKKDLEQNETPKKEERSSDKKEKRRSRKDSEGNKLSKRDVSEKEVEAVMTGLESVLRSAESSLSLASQETVKENPLLKEAFEDRASPENIVSEELEIVPTRVPHLPSRSRSRNSQGSQRDPVLYLEFESPAETSDTETLLRNNQSLPSPRTIETESTTSFGYVRPEKSLRRHETFVDRSSTGSEREGKEDRRRGIKRSESFQMGNKADYNSHRSYSPRRRGSMDLLVPLEEKEIHISGRTFTKYTPHDVERRNRMNELITAEMNRRKNRSMEDRLDQWFEKQGEEHDWTLKWKYPDIAQEKEEKLSRHKANHRQESRSPTRVENNRKSSKSKTPDSRSSSKQTDSKSPSSKYPTELSGPPPKPSRAAKQSKFSTSEIIAFNGFKNPNGFRESDYGPNFMLNKPSSRLSDFSDYGGRDYPPPPPRGRSVKDSWGVAARDKLLAGRRKGDIDPDIPTPDYTATPAGTMSSVVNSSAKHILDMPSGLY